ncbi:MAG: pyridoxine 5'-phosphate synthase [Bacteroidaceae bacterium]|nr:pyridoxine 5'-phosphate synthase [Bacteroidaceae bacterium]
MTKLSVNINKIATLRNARGGNNPDIIKTALLCETFGAQGITVHPRPDERHIRYNDVRELAPQLKTEFNIEGFPSQDFCDLVCEVKPAQVTLVPDSPTQLTSNHGWNTQIHANFLKDVVAMFKRQQIRTSIFIDASPEMAEGAKNIGADRVELYTEPYATQYNTNRTEAIRNFIQTAQFCKEIGLGLNAGHDLSLDNLQFYHKNIPWTDEVSIGHALICDALFYGLKDTIQKYLDCLK